MFNTLEERIANIEKVVRDFRHKLAAANQREESLNETINSLRAQVEKSGTPDSILTPVIGIDTHRTTKSCNYNKKRTTSHSLPMLTSRGADVKLCI